MSLSNRVIQLVCLFTPAYERNGRYMPATEEHAAQNVPYPRSATGNE